jgi:FlaA1/EpsC-like NDP-sugar epimerase
VFVLDMGQPVKIIDLARRMIHLSGLEVRDDTHPDGDVEIQVTGLRPGEKLFEELLIGDNVTGTTHPLIMRAEEEMIPWASLLPILVDIDKACQSSDLPTLRQIILKAVRGYQPTGGIEDLVWSRTARIAGEICAADGRGTGDMTNT